MCSASYSKWDGNVHNLYNGKTVNGRETVNLRGKIRYEPSSDVKITLSGNYVNGTTTVGRPFIRMAPGALLRNTAGQTVGVTMPGVNVNPENQDISNNYDSRTKYYGGGGSLRGEFGLGDLTLISITSYDKFRLNDYLDHDDTFLDAAHRQQHPGRRVQIAAVHAGSPPALARRQAVPLHGRRLLCRCAVRAAVLSRPRLLARQLVCHVQVAPGCRLRAGGLGIHAQGHADGGRPGAERKDRLHLPGQPGGSRQPVLQWWRLEDGRHLPDQRAL
jgi:hypothetical protein